MDVFTGRRHAVVAWSLLCRASRAERLRRDRHVGARRACARVHARDGELWRVVAPAKDGAGVAPGHGRDDDQPPNRRILSSALRHPRPRRSWRSTEDAVVEGPSAPVLNRGAFHALLAAKDEPAVARRTGQPDHASLARRPTVASAVAQLRARRRSLARSDAAWIVDALIVETRKRHSRITEDEP